LDERELEQKVIEILRNHGIVETEIHFGKTPPASEPFNLIDTFQDYGIWVMRKAGQIGKVVVWVIEKGITVYTLTQIGLALFGAPNLPDLRVAATDVHDYLNGQKQAIHRTVHQPERLLAFDTNWTHFPTDVIYQDTIRSISSGTPVPAVTSTTTTTTTTTLLPNHPPRPDIWLVPESSGVIRQETFDSGVPLFTAALMGNSVQMSNDVAIWSVEQMREQNRAAQTQVNNDGVLSSEVWKRPENPTA
jgi:hypothetical protein